MNQIEGVGLMALVSGRVGGGRRAARARSARLGCATRENDDSRSGIYSRPTAGRRASFARAGTSGERGERARTGLATVEFTANMSRVGCVYEWIAADGVSRLQRPHPCTVTLWTAFD